MSIKCRVGMYVCGVMCVLCTWVWVYGSGYVMCGMCCVGHVWCVLCMWHICNAVCGVFMMSVWLCSSGEVEEQSGGDVFAHSLVFPNNA